MLRNRVSFIILSLASAVLLSAGFLFPHCGGFALIGFVPLLWMDRIASRDGIRHFFWWHYLTFVLWNFFTTFWVCNATFAGGVAASLINALEMSVIWALFRLAKRYLKGSLPYVFLAALWIAWERAYYSAEVSWPWLTLGNAFARSTTCVQWYEVTGTLGGSLWVWVCNLAVFALSAALQEGRWNSFNKFARSAAIAGTVLAFAGPLTASWIRYATYEPVCEGTIDAVAFQPNFNPYEKFESMTQAQQNAVLVDQMTRSMQGRDSLSPLLFVAPETFISQVVLNSLVSNTDLHTLRSALAMRPGTNLIVGADTYQFISGAQAPSYTARPAGVGRWLESYNSAFMMDSTPRVEIYHKSRLVVGTEKMPWPRLFSKIEKALGGNIMGHCIGQEEVSLLNFIPLCKDFRQEQQDRIPLGCAVCYESVYPEYFASYVAAGAKAMAVITNDAWWGDTPGYLQHLSYSSLRAIETRRDIVRSANTGVSAFINQRGDVVSRTPWWTRTSLDGTLSLSSTLTPYVRMGDVTGRACTLICILLAVVMIARRRTEMRRR